MRKLVLLIILAPVILACFANCSQTTSETLAKDNQETTVVDSLALQLHRLDSLYNSGRLLHVDIYKIGRLKSIDFSVQSVDVEGETTQFINLRKDIGNEYYYNWEDARILPGECQYLMSAIDAIKANWHRETDHEERYAYITKDDIRVFATNEGGGAKWKIALSVDYRKDRSEVNLTEEELDSFVSLINQGLSRIREINK